MMRNRTVRIGLLVLLAAGACALAAEAPRQEANLICPVMEGNAVDRSIFVEYQGKKVYFCCESCKSAFLKAPDRYTAKLPQFAPAAAGSQEDAPAEAGWTVRRLVEPLGVLTLTLVAATVFLGVIRRLNPRPLLTIHKICGVCALASGAIHAILVLIAHSR